jgi:hypothetical protein
MSQANIRVSILPFSCIIGALRMCHLELKEQGKEMVDIFHFGGFSREVLEFNSFDNTKYKFNILTVLIFFGVCMPGRGLCLHSFSQSPMHFSEKNPGTSYVFKFLRLQFVFESWISFQMKEVISTQ